MVVASAMDEYDFKDFCREEVDQSRLLRNGLFIGGRYRCGSGTAAHWQR